MRFRKIALLVQVARAIKVDYVRDRALLRHIRVQLLPPPKNYPKSMFHVPLDKRAKEEMRLRIVDHNYGYIKVRDYITGKRRIFIAHFASQLIREIEKGGH